VSRKRPKIPNAIFSTTLCGNALARAEILHCETIIVKYPNDNKYHKLPRERERGRGGGREKRTAIPQLRCLNYENQKRS